MEERYSTTTTSAAPTPSKTVFFYPDGSSHGEGLRVSLQPHRFRNMEALMEYLTGKMPDLPYGARTIFSPRGRTPIQSLESLNNQGHYIVSDRRSRARGIQLDRLTQLPSWRTGRPPSGQRMLSYSLQPQVCAVSLGSFTTSAFGEGSSSGTAAAPSAAQRSRSVSNAPSRNSEGNRSSRDRSAGGRSGGRSNQRATKVIYVHENGDAFHRHRFTLQRRRRGEGLSLLLNELSNKLRSPVHRLFTLEGAEVFTIEDIFKGPEEYVAVGLQRFRPLANPHIDLSNKRHRPLSPSAETTMQNGPSNPQRGRSRQPVRAKHGLMASVTPTRGALPLTSARSEATMSGSGSIRSSRSMGSLGDKQAKRRVPGGNYWQVSIQTGTVDAFSGEEYSVACSANLFLTVQGTKSSTAPILLQAYQRLRNGSESTSTETETIGRKVPHPPLPARPQRREFARGQGENGVRRVAFEPGTVEEFETDVFYVEAVYLGELKFIRVWLEGEQGFGSSWCLDWIQVIETAPTLDNRSNPVAAPVSELIHFACDRWLNVAKQGHMAEVELFPIQLSEAEFTIGQPGLSPSNAAQFWKAIQWKFQPDAEIVFYCHNSGTAMQADSLGNISVTESDSRPQDSSDKDTTNEYKDGDPDLTNGSGFVIRPQLRSWVILELVNSANFEDRPKLTFDSHGRLGIRPTRPNGAQEHLWMPYVKGSMRNEGIIMLCTNHEQTICPGSISEPLTTGLKEDLVSPPQIFAWATGARDSNALWRGEGGVSCYFRVNRNKAKGFVVLESFANPNLFLSILPNGFVTTSNDGDGNNDDGVCLYPEVVKYGQSKSPHSGSCHPSRSSSIDNVSIMTRTEPEQSFTEAAENSLSQMSISSGIPPSAVVAGTPHFCRSGTIEKKSDKESDWKIQLFTSESAYNSLVVLVVYGVNGCSGPIILGASGSEKGLFRAGNVDEFKVNLRGIGPIFKIRLEVNPVDDSELPYWGLQQVIFKNELNQKHLRFDFVGRAFVSTYGHCQLAREQLLSTKSYEDAPGCALPPQLLREDGRDPSVGLVLYRVQLCVLSTPEAASDLTDSAPVPHLALFGEFGDTGRRPVALVIQKNGHMQDSTDRPLQVYESLIEAVYIGTLKNCILGPVEEEDETKDSHYLCTGVIVTDPLTGEEYRLPAQAWLSHRTVSNFKEVSLLPSDLTAR
nr:unnamed protein product [Spirometra erinaceieuropaei]